MNMYELPSSFNENENRIVNYLMLSNVVIDKIRPLLNDKHFDPKLRQQVRALLKYYDECGELPPYDFLDRKIFRKLSLESLNEDFAIAEITNFCRHKTYSSAILEGPELIENKEYAKLDELMAEARSFGSVDDPWGIVYGNEIGQIEPPEYLIRPWLVKNTVAAVYGAPGSFKSFFVLDAALQLATGIGGLEKTAVCYVAAEGATGTNLRAEAWAIHHNKEITANLMMVTKPLALTSDASTMQFINMIKRREAKTGMKTGLVAIDTLSQCMAGADENTAMSMSIATSNLIRIRRDLKTTVVFVHHSGKDESKEMRGSSVIKANTDAMIKITRNAATLAGQAVVDRQKDGPIGAQICFNLLPVYVPRHNGKELGGSLVCEVLAPGDKPESPGEQLKTHLKAKAANTLLRQVAEVVGTGKPMSLHSICVALKKPLNNQYKQPIAGLTPLDEEVLVEMPDGTKRVLVRTSINGFGEITGY